MRTKDKLAAAIRAVAKTEAQKAMALKAEAGYYDDYESPHPTPIVALVYDALSLGLRGIAKRAKDGEFDATREETDAWANSADGQRALANLSPAMRAAVLGSEPQKK